MRNVAKLEMWIRCTNSNINSSKKQIKAYLIIDFAPIEKCNNPF